MSLAAGTKIGQFEILLAIGAGGMGEVYRARDSKLGRDVAIKVLPDLFAADADRLTRFRREARLLASLNHPNIATIYGLEESAGVLALVLELVEGPTLEELLRAQGSGLMPQGPSHPEPSAISPKPSAGLPLDEALLIARQIADALEYAHEQGIVHRDLKPANIKLKVRVAPRSEDNRLEPRLSAGDVADCTVKVLDYGLAKAMEAGGAEGAGGAGEAGRLAALSQSPTMTNPAARAGLAGLEGMTGAGMILGTAAYMSPEQARGRSVDKRTDVWAFGCVLYEMLTGTRVFAGDDATETIAAVIRGEPDWRKLPPETPPAVRRLLRRALEKDARQRLPDMGSARLEIQEALAAPAETVAPSLVVPQPPPNQKTSFYPWIVAAVFLVATVALSGVAAVMYRQRAVADTRSYRASILPPDNVAWVNPPSTRLAISPDGRRLAFLATGADGVRRLWLRSLDGLTAQPLAQTEGTIVAFWSHDSRFLAFSAGGKLRKIDASGGPSLPLADMTSNSGGTWNQDDVIVFVQNLSLQRIAASGGTSSSATTLDSAGGEAGHRQPFFLPDGRHFLYHVTGSKTAPDGAIYVGSLDAGEERRLLLQGGSNAQYALGYLLFMRDTTLMAQRFDADRLQLRGEAVPLVEQIQVGGSTGRTGAFSVSQTGVLVYQAGVSVAASRLAWYDREGNEIGVVGEPGDYGDLELSGDGKRAAVSVLDPATRTRNIWLFDLARGLRTPFTFDPVPDQTSIWSPDGGSLVFSSRRKGPLDLYQKPANGAGAEDVLLVADAQDRTPQSWSPDGRFILYNTIVSSGSDLWVLPLSGDKKPFAFLQTPFAETVGRFSPNGLWIAYQSNESGRTEVYVAPFPGRAGKWLVSTAGGTFPRWGRDGREIFYIAPDGRLMAATVGAQGSGFEVGAVTPLFDMRARTGQRSPYDVSADGQRFLVNTVVGDELSSDPFTLVLNWTAGLRP